MARQLPGPFWFWSTWIGRARLLLFCRGRLPQNGMDKYRMSKTTRNLVISVERLFVCRVVVPCSFLSFVTNFRADDRYKMRVRPVTERAIGAESREWQPGRLRFDLACVPLLFRQLRAERCKTIDYALEDFWYMCGGCCCVKKGDLWYRTKFPSGTLFGFCFLLSMLHMWIWLLITLICFFNFHLQYFKSLFIRVWIVCQAATVVSFPLPRELAWVSFGLFNRISGVSCRRLRVDCFWQICLPCVYKIYFE